MFKCKKNTFLFVLLVVMFFLVTTLFAQRKIIIDKNFDPRRPKFKKYSTSTPHRLKWIPQYSNVPPSRIEQMVYNEVLEIVNDLTLWGVVVGLSPNNSPYEVNERVFKIYMNSKLMTLNLMSYVEEALVITVENYEQYDIPDNFRSENEKSPPSLFQNIVLPLGKKLKNWVYPVHLPDQEQRTNTIKTDLGVQIRLVETLSGNQIDSFYVQTIAYGNTPESSREQALRYFTREAEIGIKHFYFLFSEITHLENGRLNILLGEKFPLDQEQIFEVLRPGTLVEEDGYLYTTASKRAGFATVRTIGKDSSQLGLKRYWMPLSPGYIALEYPNPIYAFSAHLYPQATESYWRFDLQYHFHPLRLFDAGFGGQLIRISDSDLQDSWGIGFNVFGLWYLYRGGLFNLATKWSFAIDAPKIKDDYQEDVDMLLLSSQMAMVGEIKLSPRADLVLGLGYRFGIKSDTWKYDQQYQEITGHWHNDPPGISPTGFSFSVGYKFLMF